MSALPQVVRAGVHDDGATQHALRADELDVLVGHGALGVALRVGLEIAEVTDVALRVRGGAVFFAVGVDWEGVYQYRRGQAVESPISAEGVSRRSRCMGGDVQCGPAEVHPLVLSP